MATVIGTTHETAMRKSVLRLLKKIF
uniref:Phosphate acyltransferase n=1 Tax=Heterorhabditis bacteriophora TaxID=37862 RepID=A0A1I7WHX9_HETBA